MIRLEPNGRQQRADAEQQPQHGARIPNLEDAARRNGWAASDAADAQSPGVLAVSLPLGGGSEGAQRPHERGCVVAERGMAHEALTAREQGVQQVAQGVVFRAGWLREPCGARRRAVRPADEDHAWRLWPRRQEIVVRHQALLPWNGSALEPFA